MEEITIRLEDFKSDNPLRIAWCANNGEASEQLLSDIRKLAQLLHLDFDIVSSLSFRWFQSEAITMLHNDARMLEWARRRNKKDDCVDVHKKSAELENHHRLFKSFGLIDDDTLIQCQSAAKREAEGRY